MKKNFFTSESNYLDWDSTHYETVCMLIVDDNVSTDEVVESMLWALCQVGMLEVGDNFNFAKTGNTIIIGKAHNYIELEGTGTVN